MVGDDIVITVLDVRGDAVRVGVRAPRSVPVHREEVFNQVQRANQSAAETGGAVDSEAVLDALNRRAEPPAD